MPITKTPRKRQPLWKEWDRLAQKEGVRDPVYSVSGDVYTGEWSANKKHGKGTEVWKKSGAIYDGDWREGMRNGFGMYSIKKGDVHVKQYAGGWKNDKRHVISHMYRIRVSRFLRQGYGTNFYGPEEYYEGEWYADKRSGWGRMYYADGSVYEGEWYDDKRNGKGLLKLANGNRYEGSWQNDMKNGAGKFFYLDKGQVYTGTWVDDIAKCGSLEDFGREGAPDPPAYPIPEVSGRKTRCRICFQVPPKLHSTAPEGSS